MMRWGSILLAALLAAAAQAQDLVVHSRDGISYVAGGIGEAERTLLKAREAEFNLKLVFTLVEGSYVSDVDVEVKDGAGKALIAHRAMGPYFLARLPVGQYAVTATYEGRAQTRKVKLGERLRAEYLRWPSDPRTDFVPPREEVSK